MKNLDKNYHGLLIKECMAQSAMLMAKNAGFDFVMFDNEHTVMDKEKLQALLVLNQNIELPSLVRIPEISRKEIQQILDAGATGILVPMVETKEQAQQIVDFSLYPPLGKRGYSSGAHTNFMSGSHATNIERLNKRNIILVQIETVEGLKNVNDIISTKGIDGVIIGPVDLSISLDCVGNIFDEKEINAIEEVAKLCENHHKLFGIITGKEMLNRFKEQTQYFISSIDTTIMRNAFKEALETSKK